MTSSSLNFKINSLSKDLELKKIEQAISTWLKLKRTHNKQQSKNKNNTNNHNNNARHKNKLNNKSLNTKDKTL